MALKRVDIFLSVVEQSSVDSAKATAARNRVLNCRFVVGDATEMFDARARALSAVKNYKTAPIVASSRKVPKLSNPEAIVAQNKINLPSASETMVILDPPRKGCSKEMLDALLKYQPATIVYVSCDPPTMARDAHIICEKEYEIVDVTPFDMFPQTKHVECVMIFKSLAK